MTLPKQKYCSQCGSQVTLLVPEGDNRERAVCNKCGAIFYENPKIVAGCILEYNNKILLCKRATEPRSGYWTLPAGFLENNETVEEGALRETWEEANAKSSDVKLFMMCNLPHISQVYMMYYGKLLDEKFSPGIESSDVQLFSKEDIPWDELAFVVIEKTLKAYYKDVEKNHIGIHFDTIIKTL